MTVRCIVSDWSFLVIIMLASGRRYRAITSKTKQTDLKVELQSKQRQLSVMWHQQDFSCSALTQGSVTHHWLSAPFTRGSGHSTKLHLMPLTYCSSQRVFIEEKHTLRSTDWCHQNRQFWTDSLCYWCYKNARRSQPLSSSWPLWLPHSDWLRRNWDCINNQVEY